MLERPWKESDERREEVVEMRGGKRALVGISLLARDLVDYAQMKGIERELAEGFMRNLTLVTSWEDLHQKTLTSRFLGWQEISEEISQAFGWMTFWGYVREIGRNEAAALLNLPVVAQKLPGVWTGRETNKEIQLAALRESLNFVWRHEREHLTHLMNPRWREIIRKESQGLGILTGLSWGFFALAGSLSPEVALDNFSFPLGVSIALVGFTAGRAIVMNLYTPFRATENAALTAAFEEGVLPGIFSVDWAR